MRLKYNHRKTFWRKPRLQSCPQSRVLANLAKTPKSAIFWNSSKGGPRENRSKSGPTSAAWKTLPNKLSDLLIDMRWEYNHRRTFWRKPRFQSCPQSRVLANFAKTPKSAIFWNSSKGGPRENRSKSGPTSAAWKTLASKLSDLLIDMRWEYNHRRTFWRKPRLQSCPQSRVLANLAKTPKSAIFWNSSKGGPRENRSKSGPTSAAWKTLPNKLSDLLIDMRWEYNHRRTFWRKPRFQSCPQSRVLANLAKTPKSAIFWNSSKGGPRENRSKSGPTSAAWKTLASKLSDLLIDMRFAYNHRRTFWRKPRLQSCPQSRVLANLAKTPKSAIFWNSSKGGPRENRSKSGPTSAAWKTLPNKLSDLLIDMRWEYNYRRTFWRKAPPKLPAKSSSSQFSKDTKIGHFLKFFEGGTKGKSFKKWADLGGLKNTREQTQRSPNWYALRVQSSENILTQTALPKLPAKSSSSQFSKDTKIGHFLKFFKGGTKGKSFKKWADLGGLKNTPEQTQRSPNWYALKVQSSENILTQAAPPKLPAKSSSSQFSKDTKIGHFGWNSSKGGPRENRSKSGPTSAAFLNDFPLVPPLKNFKKWPILVSLLNWLELDFAGSFGSAVCVKMFSDDCTLSAYQLGDRWVCSRVFFKPPRSAHFLNDFPLVPPLKNFKKWPILVSLLNWLELDFAGSFGSAVCVKMFSDDCTLSAYQLGDRWVCSGVFFKPPRSAHFLNDFPLVPPLKNFKKWPILVSLLNWLELDFAGSFGGAACVKMFSDNCTFSAYQLGDRWVCSGVFFKPPRSAHFLNDFPLVPPLKNFKKWPILVSLLNWLELDFAGSFGSAVCVKMFSDDCTFSAYQLRDRRVCSRVCF